MLVMCERESVACGDFVSNGHGCVRIRISRRKVIARLAAINVADLNTKNETSTGRVVSSRLRGPILTAFDTVTVRRARLNLQ